MVRSVSGLLIDYGGVLTNPLGPVLADFCRAKGLADDAIVALHAPDCGFRLELESYERGEFEDAAFLPRLAHALGLPSIDVKDLLAGVRPDERMFRALESIRAHGIRIGLLSNSWGVSAYPMERFATLFDGVVISCKVGMRKPEADIYLHAARLIGLAPQDCVFVDDTLANVVAAAAAGMTVVYHGAPAQTLRELERLFGIVIEEGSG